jgi:hypothetical protein
LKKIPAILNSFKRIKKGFLTASIELQKFEFISSIFLTFNIYDYFIFLVGVSWDSFSFWKIGAFRNSRRIAGF